VNGTGANGSVFAAVGIFSADGQGNITSGQEDFNDQLLGVQQQIQFTGRYAIGSDGRGQAIFIFANSSATPATFDFVLSSTSAGRLIEFTSNGVATGRLEKQGPPILASIDGTYVLRLDGFTPSGSTLVPISRVGSLSVSGSAASAVLDENLNGTFTQLISTTATVSFTPGALGRGTMQMTLPAGGVSGTGSSSSLVFYAVNADRLEFLSLDASAPVAGGADAQAASIAVSGDYVFSISGFSTNGNIAETGSFGLNGGVLSSGLEDAAENGAFAPAISISGTYAGGSNNGRQTGRFTSGNRTVDFVLWFSNAANGVMMTTDSTLLESGTVLLQAVTPSNSTLNGNYALHFSGLTFSGPLALEGQLQANGQGVFTGLEDFNLVGNLQTGRSASGSYSFAANGRGTGVIGGTSVVLYAADGNTIFIMSSDGTLLAGSLEGQH
jgi:hypothetical protein